MPILYTTEIDDILRQSLEEVAKYKSEIVEELIRIYNSVDTKDKIEAETTKCKAEMDTILQRKDRLLDLSISGNLSNAEFAARNERFNAELKTLEDRLAELEKQRQDDQDRVQYTRALKQMISRELDFSEGFTVGLVDALLDHMEVMGTGRQRRSADQVEANAGGRKKEAAGDTDPHYQRGQRRPNLYHSVNFKRRGR